MSAVRTWRAGHGTADEDTDNIGIHSAYQSGRIAMIQGIKQVNHYPGVSLFMFHGSMEWVGYVPTILVSDVPKTCLPSGQAVDAIFLERKANSSCESCGKSGNFLAACSDQLPSVISPCLVSPLLISLCCW